VLLLLAALPAGCSSADNRVTAPIPSGPSLTTPPPSTIQDLIEFRVFGSVGDVPVALRYSDSLDGLTVLPAVSLPYTARVSTTQTSLFLYIQADVASPGVYYTGTPAVLQVQIVVNGAVFREGFMQGYTSLSATASGTWRRGS
jgi:hypothetical protein